jgi:hypothetical protein
MTLFFAYTLGQDNEHMTAPDLRQHPRSNQHPRSIYIDDLTF